MSHSVIRSLMEGLAAGTLATVPMTAVMQTTRQISRQEARRPFPPQQITHQAAKDIGLPNHPDDDRIMLAALIGHFAYGALCGAGYAMIAPRRHPMLAGTGAGLGVWAASYMGWLPVIGWHRPPQRESTPRNLALIASHLTWGAATGMIFHALQRRANRTHAQHDRVAATKKPRQSEA